MRAPPGRAALRQLAPPSRASCRRRASAPSARHRIDGNGYLGEDVWRRAELGLLSATIDDVVHLLARCPLVLRHATEGAPDLIILDAMPPRMIGLDVRKRIRALLRTVPIILLTARGAEYEPVSESAAWPMI